MQKQSEKPCGWSRCDVPVEKHVRFGNRSFGPAGIMDAPNQNYTAIHRNLCAKHVNDVRAQYLDVEVFELGECPSCRR